MTNCKPLINGPRKNAWGYLTAGAYTGQDNWRERNNAKKVIVTRTKGATDPYG